MKSLLIGGVSLVDPFSTDVVRYVEITGIWCNDETLLIPLSGFIASTAVT